MRTRKYFISSEVSLETCKYSSISIIFRSVLIVELNIICHPNVIEVNQYFFIVFFLHNGKSKNDQGIDKTQ